MLDPTTMFICGCVIAVALAAAVRFRYLRRPTALDDLVEEIREERELEEARQLIVAAADKVKGDK